MHPFDSQIRFIQSTNYNWVNPKTPRIVTLLSVHSMESPDKPSTAEGVAAWFAKPNPKPGEPRDKVRNCPEASAHACADVDSVVACVMPKDVAWACSASNWCSYNIELAGFAAQTREQWLAPDSLAMLKLVAAHLLLACTFFGIPPRLLDEEELAECLRDSSIRQGKIPGAVAGNPGGITTHAACNAVWKKAGLYGLPVAKGDLSHWDPGPHFPMDVLVQLMTPPQAEQFPLGGA